jgi:Cytidylyltransferase-like
MCVGYLARSFDLFNVGDLDVIEQASNHCRELVLGVLNDELVKEVYGRPPIVPIDQRVFLLDHVRGVSRVEVHSGWDGPVEKNWMIFAVADETPEPPPESIFLMPSRRTASPALLDALEPVRSRAVA